MHLINRIFIIVFIFSILIYLQVINRHVLFDKVFNKLLDYCFRFNKDTPDVFLHIKGGSSIKYHMINNNIPSDNITNDIDIVIVSTNNKPNWKQSAFLKFIDGLRSSFPYFTWSYDKVTNFIFEDIYLNDIYLNVLPEIIRVKLNATKIFDITFYDKHYRNELPKLDLFTYSIKKLYNMNNSKYYSKLIILHSLRNLNPDNLEKLTITKLEIEKIVLEKRISNRNYILKNIVSKSIQKSIILHKLINNETNIDKIIIFHQMIQFLHNLNIKYADKQYIHKRFAIYNRKISIINTIL
jgi:hypothetical protein